MMSVDVILSAATGLLSATGAASALVLLARCESCEVSARAVMAFLVASACFWCLIEAIYLQSTPPQTMLMLVAAVHTLRAIAERRKMTKARDLNPFA